MTLVMTCPAHPEQYDAVDADGYIIGYLRLRHGVFTAECPDVDGELVYYREFEDGRGEGIPEADMRKATEAIAEYARDGQE